MRGSSAISSQEWAWQNGARRPRNSLLGPCGYIGIALLIMVAMTAPAMEAKQKKVSRQVSGLVLDAADNPLANASVTLTDITEGKKLGIYTKEDGLYLFTDLNPSHDYAVQATFDGRSSDVRKVSTFDNRTRIVLNLRIPPPPAPNGDKASQ